MKTKTKLAAGILALCMAANFSGCAGNGSASSQTNTAPSSSSSAASSQKDTLKGSVTIYTSQPEQDIQALIQAFNKKQPEIKVNVFRSGTEEVVSKILAKKKAGAVKADLLLVADAATFESLKSADLLMSYASPELKGISSDYYDADHTYTGTKIISTGIVINTDLVKKPPAGYKDLKSADYKDNLVMPSPLYSGAAAYNLGVLTRTDGIGWDYYQSLKTNGVSVQQGNGAVEKAVLAGQKSCGIVVDYLALRDKAKGAPVDFIYPSEGSLSVTEPIGIVKGTPNERQAKAFVDFLLSDGGQAATSQIGYTPIKSGVKAPDGFQSVDQIKNLTYDLSKLVQTRDSDKEKFSKMFG
ncbi:Bacterial extracellular solute-binding protein [Caprobacter fermentans]|uniref:Bacterial extracellular solute-binding protein n=1 Tax=Caproicibacter fermentans TaxID=2576756 RepID=A0A6N8I0E0_9FIRM|nr:ABC transporter substrate-binding protein [Caproicibacter fermentans]MVB11197.1 Bacterial extracellular solute-binding protein [Caproicibacter fermentans]